MPFLYHWMEIHQFDSSGEIIPTYLLVMVMLWVVITGLVSFQAGIGLFSAVNAAMIGISVLLANIFITPPNASWFNPYGMNAVLILSGFLLTAGQWIVRAFTKMILKSND